jgi:predicted esterase
MSDQNETFQFQLPVKYQWHPRANATELVILLHGYQSRGDRISRDLLSAVPDSASVLIPTGPFPVPVRIDDGFREAYAWYFYDSKTKSMLISLDPATEWIAHLIHQCGASTLPVRIVGFSQGGFFAPYVGQKIKNVKHVIALSAGFPERYFGNSHPFRLDAIHGTEDGVCPYAVARDEHKLLIDKGWCGEFVTLPGTEHRIDDSMRSEVARLLKLRIA